jgi:DNA-directed RNA polymerase subunit M/transcription elongation factor TFIIS
MKFCSVCNGRLQGITTDTTIYFQCAKCKKRHPPEPSDTLMYEEVIDRKDSNIKFDTFLRNAAHDNTNPLMKKSCPKCKKQFVRYVVIGKMKKFIYVCTCGHRF